MRHGRVFALARQTSQGRQRTYNTASSHASDEIDNDTFIRQNALQSHFDIGTPRPLLKRTRTGAVADRRPSLSLEIPDDEINTETFKKYDETGFFIPPVNVFKNIFEDDDYHSDDEIDKYIPTDNNTTCFATPDVLKTMRSISKRDT